MKRVSIARSNPILRPAVLCAVLVGLLFSCSEGVRLIPFPDIETTKSGSPQFNFKNKIPYQFNVRRFEDTQGGVKTKLKRKTPSHHWLETGVAKSAAAVHPAGRKKNDFPVAPEKTLSHLFSKPGPSRAPPSIS